MRRLALKNWTHWQLHDYFLFKFGILVLPQCPRLTRILRVPVVGMQLHSNKTLQPLLSQDIVTFAATAMPFALHHVAAFL